MDFHQVVVTPLTKGGIALTVKVGNRSTHSGYKTLESALDSFAPPLSARVRSHLVEAVRGEQKGVVFCLEDSLQEQ